MRVVASFVLQLLMFGALSALMVIEDPAQSSVVIGLFVVGELWGTSMLCSVIVKHFREGSLPGWLRETAAGYSVSHACILAVLYLGPLNNQPLHASGQSTLAWMQLVLGVGLTMVVTLTAGVLLQRRIAEFAGPRLRKITAAF